MKSSKTKKPPAEPAPVYVPNIPEPTNRAALLEHWMNLTFNDKTANRMLWISEGGSKVCRRTKEVCPVLDTPERYEYSPQVLCKESIWNARGYWEVECNGWVVVGVSYEEAGRRVGAQPSGLGENEQSWGLCWAGTRYQVWYDGICKEIYDVPFTSRIGVYVDQPAGILSFYILTGEGAEKEAMLLHKITTPLEGKLIPGFWMGIQSEVLLMKKPE